LTFGGDFTIEAWVYITSLATYHPILEGRSTGGSYSNYVFGIFNLGGTLRLDFVNAGGATGRSATTTSVPLNTWTHVAWVRSGGTTSYYVNGVKDATTNSYSASLAPASSNVLIGAVVDPYYFNGYIDELRVTNGIARYTTSFTPPTREFPAIFGPNTDNNPILASGGNNIIDDATNGYRTHVFTSPGSFVVYNNPAPDLEYLVVAGGGGGGGNRGGGGGAGGFRTGTGFPVTAATYPITVGGGGNGIASGLGGNGSQSIFSTITSTGGGGGASNVDVTLQPGGSGGGGNYSNPTGGTGNTPPVSPPQGNPGGGGLPTPGTYRNGGGGGAGAAGSGAGPTGSGPGGVGSPITWLPASYGTPGPAPGRWFAGGGGGGAGSESGYASPYTPGGNGGSGGGGKGSTRPSTQADPGTTNTGGGGGGTENPSVFPISGSGGSGIVAVRYPKTFDNIVRDGLVLNLDAGDVSSYPGSGTTWTDLSGSGYSGTLVNGVGYDGSNGGSLVFDGSNDYVDLNTNNIITGTNPFTFEAFYKVTNTSVAGEIFGNYGSGYTANTIWISGRYGVYINASVPYFQGAPLGAGTYHIAFTRTSAGACVLYKNAVVDGTATSTTSISVGLNFRIGSDVNGIGEVFGGNIYNIKVYNRALTASEIEQNYNALKDRFGL
jgi:hypothetical protein